MVPDRPESDPSASSPSGSSGIRRRIEEASNPAIAALARMPAMLPFVVMLVVLLTGVFVGGVIGAILLALPIAFLGWLLYLTWPHLRMPERLLRVAVLLLVLAIAVTQILPR